MGSDPETPGEDPPVRENALADGSPTSDADLIAALVPDYLASRRQDCLELRRRLEAGDYAWIADLGHRLKGSGKTYGFAAITEIGDGLERAGHRREHATLARWAGRLERLLETLEPTGR